MKPIEFWLKLALVACMLLARQVAYATPVRCSMGYQDSSCVGTIAQAPQQPTSCPTGAGYTTIAGAQWIGSRYTAPQCNYQPAPTCPSGDIQTAAASWTGSTWTGLQCGAPSPPTPPAATCTYIPGVTYGYYYQTEPVTKFTTSNLFTAAFEVVVNGAVLYGSTTPVPGNTSAPPQPVLVDEAFTAGEYENPALSTSPLAGYYSGPLQSSQNGNGPPVWTLEYFSICHD